MALSGFMWLIGCWARCRDEGFCKRSEGVYWKATLKGLLRSEKFFILLPIKVLIFKSRKIANFRFFFWT